LFREYSRRVGAAYAESGQALDALLNFYDAFSEYRARAARYLSDAREYERALVPASEASYDFEMGKLMANPGMIETAIVGFDPVWQRDISARAYEELALILSPGSREKAEAAERLFALNRGSLPASGIALPVELTVGGAAGAGGKAERAAARAVERIARKSGFAPLRSDGRTRYTLKVDLGENGARCVLRDSLRGIAVADSLIALPSLSAVDLARFGRELSALAFGGN
jgi:hypothetical protein